MCLQLLPHGKIEQAFDKSQTATRDIDDRRQCTLVWQLCDYVKETWMVSTVWPRAAWSVYVQEVKFIFYMHIRIYQYYYMYICMVTKNYVEGWHNNLHNHAGQKYSYNALICIWC